jgi:hypothetical protein
MNIKINEINNVYKIFKDPNYIIKKCYDLNWFFFHFDIITGNV